MECIVNIINYSANTESLWTRCDKDQVKKTVIKANTNRQNAKLSFEI